MCFLRCLRLVFQTPRNTLPEHLLKLPNAKVCRSHAQLHPYQCLRLFPEENVDGHPSFTSSSHDNPGSWPHKAHSPVSYIQVPQLSTLLYVYPPTRPISSESHIVVADILQCLVTTKPTISVAGTPFNAPSVIAQ